MNPTVHYDPPWLHLVEPTLDANMTSLCTMPYPLHPKGCPNYGKRDSCPPSARFYADVYDLNKPVYAVVNEFNLGAHASRMKEKHENWSDRQLYCVLYWQGTARKQLRLKIKEALGLAKLDGYCAETCPEAMGVNVTDTLAKVGVCLEWPPRYFARQVALLGVLRVD